MARTGFQLQRMFLGNASLSLIHVRKHCSALNFRFHYSQASLYLRVCLSFIILLLTEIWSICVNGDIDTSAILVLYPVKPASFVHMASTTYCNPWSTYLAPSGATQWSHSRTKMGRQRLFCLRLASDILNNCQITCSRSLNSQWPSGLLTAIVEPKCCRGEFQKQLECKRIFVYHFLI